MNEDLIILEAEPARRRQVAEYCVRRGYRPKLACDFMQFASCWRPEHRVSMVSLAATKTDGIDAIRFLAEHGADSTLILTGDTDTRILSAASRLARARGLRVRGMLQQPFGSAELGSLLLRPEEQLNEQSMVLAIQLAREDLRDCLKRGLVRTWFQPKIELHTLQFAGVEALVRLEHPTRGLLRPSAFVALAEESGLIGELTEAIMCEAFSWAARWLARGINMQVAINISPFQLADANLPDTLEAWTQAFKLPPERITLEVTETWISDDSIATLDSLTRLRLQGFHLSIDDFGTGYSTMAQLNEIPYSEMKLDQSFVRNATLDGEARAIVESSIQLGHKLGMRVVAEGIERQEDWDLVAELGCDHGQGYFLARPMKPEDLPDWIERWNATRGKA
jgi:EAL domain-containing protein (putative c-di-GMP-specific phosphodiesterase class I)